MVSNQFPQDFVDQIESLLGEEAESFFQSMEDDSTTSIRLHPSKKYTNPAAGTKIPYTDQGYYLEERPRFTYDPCFHAGGYYVQDASSMFLEHVMKQLIPHPCATTKVLDLCAAPGGKTTILLSHLNGQGVVVANEVIQARAKILEENITKWGYSNCILTKSDSSYFVTERATFDLVLIDAPCSGEGLFRKDPEAIKSWSRKHVNHCALRQQRILDNAVQLVLEKGYLVYSTCTYNREENDYQVQLLVDTGDWKSIDITYNESWGIEKSNSAIHGYHFYPHRARGEGFYISVLQRITPTQIGIKKKKRKGKGISKGSVNKKGLTQDEFQIIVDYVSDQNPAHYYKNRHDIICHWQVSEVFSNLVELRHIRRGTQIGKLIKNKLKPAHSLSQSLLYTNHAPCIEVSLEQAILYLKGQMPPLDIQETGWVIIMHNSLPLGWIKVINKNRYNNYYPKHLRIRK